MNPAVVAVAIAVGAAALALALYRAANLKRQLGRSGERVLFGPELGFYQGMIRGIVSTKTYGVIALTDRRLIFRKPIGRDIEIPLSQITAVSENEWFAGNYRGGREFLILKLADASEKAFQVKDHAGWMRELRSRLAAG